MEKLYTEAMNYKVLYNSGKCTREEAKEHIMPYLDFVNSKSKEIAKKYNMKPKPIVSFVSFIR